MERFIQYVISGLSIGSLYALVALGVVLIYRANRVLNFAHGDVTTVGAFVAFALLGAGLPWSLAFLLAMIGGALVSMGFYFGILIPAQRREATHLGQIILTLGLGLVIQGLILRFGATEPQTFPFPLSDTKVYQVGGVVISQLSLGALIVGLIGSLIFYLLVQKTRLGLAMRATSENLQAAQTLGIPTRPVLALAWGLAAVLGVLAGLFLAATLFIDPFFMLEPFLKGFAAAILGGLNSLPGAIVGGLILGVAEALAGGFISVAFKNTLAFLIIIVVLLFRPEGLLGTEFIERI
ncbi:MAG: branched-chain amino acid ABC transporter permease [Thermodesulfobacteriota bacterium]